MKWIFKKQAKQKNAPPEKNKTKHVLCLYTLSVLLHSVNNSNTTHNATLKGYFGSFKKICVTIRCQLFGGQKQVQF